jgi:hypothetical protein
MSEGTRARTIGLNFASLHQHGSQKLMVLATEQKFGSLQTGQRGWFSGSIAMTFFLMPNV